jgi:hypothetical protein
MVNGVLPAGLTLNPQSGIVSGTPERAGTSEFTLRVTDATSATSNRACTISVNDAVLSITSAEVLPEAAAGTTYAFELRAAGGRGPYVWTVVEGAFPEGLSLDSSGRISGTPATPGTFAATIRVTDSSQTVVSQQIRITVRPAAAPAVSFVDMPEILGPAQQVRVSLQLNGSYPAPLDGTVRMTFSPDPGIDVDDASIQFATGGRRASFRVSPGDTLAAFALPDLLLQTGTVAGTIQLSVELTANGQPVGTPAMKSMRIDRLAPRISSVSVIQTAGGFEVRITGFSTTRDVTEATFRFTPAPGSSLEETELVLPMADESRTWFNDSRSHAFGSQFLLVQPFTVENAILSSVSVSLTNGQGTSQVVSAQFRY